MNLKVILIPIALGVLGWIGYTQVYRPHRQESQEKRQLEEAFLRAVLEGDRQQVERLLDAGVDVNAKDKYGRTAVEIAASQGWTQMVEMLQKRSAKPPQTSQTHRRVRVRRST